MKYILTDIKLKSTERNKGFPKPMSEKLNFEITLQNSGNTSNYSYQEIMNDIMDKLEYVEKTNKDENTPTIKVEFSGNITYEQAFKSAMKAANATGCIIEYFFNGDTMHVKPNKNEAQALFESIKHKTKCDHEWVDVSSITDIFHSYYCVKCRKYTCRLD